ncbi:MAG: CerR family C-terminal domain-containing protein [Gemmataceae bacterium]
MALADDTRERLLEAAGQIFAEKGFRSATVRDICEKAGVNIAAINYHFGDKEKLYIAAVQHAHSCRIEEVPLPDWGEETPPERKLRDFIRVMIERVVVSDAPTWHLQLIMREMVEPTAACEVLVNENIRPMAQVMSGILAELLPADMPEHQRFLFAFSIVGQCLFHRTHRPIIALLVGEDGFRKYTGEVLAEHITQFTLAALGHAPPIGKRKGKP